MPITQKNTILSIDWNLHMWSSHPGSICRNLLKADSTLAVLTYIELEDAPDPSWEKRIDRLLTVSDWFLEAKKVWHNPILDTFSEVWQISPKLYEQVDRYLESSAFKPKFIIVQDASFHNTLAISRLCKKRDIPVVFYFHTVRHRKFIGFFRAFIKNRKNVFFASIHPEIARKISKAIASRVHAVPYPVEIDA